VNLGIFEWEERLIDVTVAAAGSRSHPGLRIHRVAAFGPDDVCRHRHPDHVDRMAAYLGRGSASCASHGRRR
jgi:hypothetical protein